MTSGPGHLPAATDESDSASRKNTLKRLQEEAEELGQSERVEAFRRLALMGEVRECLAEESPGAAAEVASFCAEALERLLHRGEESGPDDAALWILRESSAHWGDYLRLIDPSSESPTEELGYDESNDDAPAAIDPGALFRMLTGNLDTSGHDESDWATQSDWMEEPKPVAAKEPDSTLAPEEFNDLPSFDPFAERPVQSTFEIPPPPTLSLIHI